VAAGTYHESLLWSGKDLTLQGAGEGASFIDPGGANGGLTAAADHSDLTPASHIANFTFQHALWDWEAAEWQIQQQPDHQQLHLQQQYRAFGAGCLTRAQQPDPDRLHLQPQSSKLGRGMYNADSSPT